MKMKITVLVTFVFLTFLIAPAVIASAGSGGVAGTMMAGGYTGDMSSDGTRKNGSRGAGGLSLDELREGLRNGERSEGRAESPPVNPELMGDSLSGGLTDDFFDSNKKVIPVIHRQLYETAGYLNGDMDGHGEIVDGSRSGQVAFSMAEEVYINRGTKDGVTKGDRFLVFHKDGNKILHPVTKKSMGHKIVVDGIIKVVKVLRSDSKAVIVRAFDTIERGDKISLYDQLEAPGTDPDSPVKDKKIDGYLVTSKGEGTVYGQGDVVYFDVGARIGVETGDVFDIIDAKPVLRRDGTMVKGFPKVKGKAKILLTKDKTSTAYIYSSNNVITKGDKITFSPTRYE